MRARLRRRYSTLESQGVRFHEKSESSLLAARLAGDAGLRTRVRSFLLSEEAPVFFKENVDLWLSLRGGVLSELFSLRLSFFRSLSTAQVFFLSAVREVGSASFDLFDELSIMTSRFFWLLSTASAEQLVTWLTGMCDKLLASSVAWGEAFNLRLSYLCGRCDKDCS